MTPFHRLTWFLACFLLFIVTIPAVSAYTVSSVAVSPAGYQAAGTPMIVSFVIDFPKGNAETFPQENELEMSTSLVKATWAPAMILDGIQTNMDEKMGQSLTISGWYLSYPSYQDLQVRVTLRGTIPENLPSGQDLVKIVEMDSGHSVRSTARVAMPEAPLVVPSALPPRSVPSKIPATKKIFTPIPTDTPTQQSPAGIETGIIAVAGAVLVVAGRN